MEHITRIGNFVSASYHVVDRPNGRPTDPFDHRIGAARIGTTIGQPNGPLARSHRVRADMFARVYAPNKYDKSRLAQLVERVTSMITCHDEVSRSSRLMGINFSTFTILL